MSVVTVGRVPLATRVEGENVIPGGSPDRLYSYGALPPVAAGNKVLTTPPDGTREFGMPGRDSGGTKRGLAPASLSILAAAVGAAASSAGVKDPRGPVTRRTLRKLKREHAARGRGQVEGLRREAAVAAARLAAEEGTALGLRDAALLRLGSDGLLRISELVAVQVDDLGPREDGSGVLALPRSKTDQEGEGSTLYVCRETMAAVAAELMQAGRWTDAATATRYAANELAERGAVARYFEDDDG